MTMPTSMTQRSLDHFVISVADIEIAAEMYRHLGFRVMPVMEHNKVGTANVCIQFQDTYLELIGDSRHAEVQQIKDFLRPWEETNDYIYWQTSVTSDNLTEDRPVLEKLGLVTNEILDAARKVRKIGGGFDETASRSMYIPNQKDIRASMFISEHNKPEAIWMPGYNQHPNMVTRVKGIRYIATDPSEFETYYRKIVGADGKEGGAEGFRFITPRDEFFEVMPEAEAQKERPWISPLEKSLPIRGAEFTYEVSDIERCHLALRDGGVPHRIGQNGEIQVETIFGCGMATIFVESGS